MISFRNQADGDSPAAADLRLSIARSAAVALNVMTMPCLSCLRFGGRPGFRFLVMR